MSCTAYGYVLGEDYSRLLGENLTEQEAITLCQQHAEALGRLTRTPIARRNCTWMSQGGVMFAYYLREE